MSTQEDLRSVALVEFASVGYGATSLQRIAELAGLSKSSVLYHYSSKEHLLAAAIGPAVDRMEQLLDAGTMGVGDNRDDFLEAFVDLLLRYRLEVNIFINQGPSLVDVPVIDRATSVVLRLAEYYRVNVGSLEERMRFGIALGGAAYMLCTIQALELDAGDTVDETRAVLITILSDLLTPVNH